MAVTEEEMRALVGRRFPGGTATIERWENVFLCDVMGVAPAADGTAHPAFLFHLPLNGAGVTIRDLFALCRAESEEAVRAGEYRWELHRPLRVGATYRVSGGFVSVERRRGRRAGLMDAVTYRMDLEDAEDGAPTATTHTTVLFLRPE